VLASGRNLKSLIAASKKRGHDSNLLGSRDVIGHVTIRLAVVDFLWVIHGEHASILHRYGDMKPQMLDTETWTRKEKRKKGKGEKGRKKGRYGKRKVEVEKKGKGEKGREGKGKRKRRERKGK